VPTLAKTGWALFMDCDMMALTNVARLFEGLDPSKAVYCVKHSHETGKSVKMDGQMQTFYARKNWSSFMVFNCEHPSNRALTIDMVNSLPGRDLHRLCWLKDDEIGDLDPSWNFLVGHSDPSIQPKIIHWTNGGPWFREYEDVPYSKEWFDARDRAVA
jgi:lipopolysaccharide biosynthesis glycosyltransferase